MKEYYSYTKDYDILICDDKDNIYIIPQIFDNNDNNKLMYFSAFLFSQFFIMEFIAFILPIDSIIAVVIILNIYSYASCYLCAKFIISKFDDKQKRIKVVKGANSIYFYNNVIKKNNAADDVPQAICIGIICYVAGWINMDLNMYIFGSLIIGLAVFKLLNILPVEKRIKRILKKELNENGVILNE